MAEVFTPITLASLSNATTAINQINSNFAQIATLFNDVLSLSGVTPNSMNSTLNMNSNQITNLPAPISAQSPVRVEDISATQPITVPPTGTSGAVVPFLNGNNTWSGTDTFSQPVTFNSTATFTGTTTLPAGTVTGSEIASTTITSSNIANNTITPSQQAQIATGSILGNNSGVTANISSLTPTTVTGMLNTFTSSTQGLVSASGGGTTNFARADGTWNAPIAQGAVAASFKNMNVTNTSAGTPNTQCIVTADQLSLYNSSGGTYQTVINVNVTISSGSSGANGLDTGSVAATSWYAIYVIYNPTTQTTAGLMSLSSSSPTMPSGYTFLMRVGWMRTDSSGNFLRIWQKGRKAVYVITASTNTTVLPSMLASASSGNVTTPTWTAIAVGNYVPTATAESIDVVLNIPATLTSTSQTAMVAPNNAYGAYNSATAAGPMVYTSGNDGGGTSVRSGCSQRQIMFLESTNIYTAISTVSTANIQCAGWIDNI